MRRYLIELLGTFALVLTAVVAFGRGEPLAALAVGAVLAGMLALDPDDDPALRPHLNPAVSLGALLQGRLAAAEVFPYWAAQLLGALLGATLGLWLAEVPAGPALGGEQLLRAGAVELVLAFLLALVALTTRTGPHAFAAGLVMAAGLLVAAPLSGGALNPALAFGQAVSGLGSWGSIWVILVATFAGGGLAGLAAGQLSSRPG